MSENEAETGEFPFERPVEGPPGLREGNHYWSKAWDTPEGRAHERKRKAVEAARKLREAP